MSSLCPCHLYSLILTHPLQIDFEQKTALYSINDLTLLYLKRERNLPEYTEKVTIWKHRFVTHLTDVLDGVADHLEESNDVGSPSESAALQTLRRERPNIAAAMNYSQELDDMEVRNAFLDVIDEVFRLSLSDTRCRRVLLQVLGNYEPFKTSHSANDIVVNIPRSHTNPLFSSAEIDRPLELLEYNQPPTESQTKSHSKPSSTGSSSSKK